MQDWSRCNCHIPQISRSACKWDCQDILKHVETTNLVIQPTCTIEEIRTGWKFKPMYLQVHVSQLRLSSRIGLRNVEKQTHWKPLTDIAPQRNGWEVQVPLGDCAWPSGCSFLKAPSPATTGMMAEFQWKVSELRPIIPHSSDSKGMQREYMGVYSYFKIFQFSIYIYSNHLKSPGLMQ
jgi:hypothetical protein